MLLAFAMTALGVPARTFLPIFAKQVFHRGPATYTMFLSVAGVGSVLGAAQFGQLLVAIVPFSAQYDLRVALGSKALPCSRLRPSPRSRS